MATGRGILTIELPIDRDDDEKVIGVGGRSDPVLLTELEKAVDPEDNDLLIEVDVHWDVEPPITSGPPDNWDPGYCLDERTILGLYIRDYRGESRKIRRSHFGEQAMKVISNLVEGYEIDYRDLR